MFLRTNTRDQKIRAALVALVFFASLVVAACSASTRQLFFDIPPPDPRKQAEKERLAAEQAAEAARAQEESDRPGNSRDSRVLLTGDDEGERPAVEGVLDWTEVSEMLPRDYKGDTDWSEALRQGLVKPRSKSHRETAVTAGFKYDFIIANDKPKFEAWFPHSAHTAWLDCTNCHTAIYPYQRNPATMKEMRDGASCGACHGKVAFSLKNCKRCHLEM